MGMFVAGRWQASPERIHVVAPHSRRAIGRVPLATPDQVDEAEGEAHARYSAHGGTSDRHVPRCLATSHKDSTGDTRAG
jgi:acyl-CoA reductase-like NAD-dependent aldehyde dehydrogenase